MTDIQILTFSCPIEIQKELEWYFNPYFFWCVEKEGNWGHLGHFGCFQFRGDEFQDVSQSQALVAVFHGDHIGQHWNIQNKKLGLSCHLDISS